MAGEPVRVGLRVDVDFACDLRSGVPFMLDVLREHRMRATFFVNAGGRTGARGAWLKRLGRGDAWRRYLALGPWRILTRMGPAILLAKGDRLTRSAGVLRRIVAEGHELGLHGFDHTWWAGNVWSAARSELEAEVDRARAALASATGLDRVLWASPGWRTTDEVVEILHERGVPYLTECWGHEPFRTRTRSGREIPVPHLPVTMPSLETLRITRGLEGASGVAASLDGRAGHDFDVMCMHGYYEGLIAREVFPLFLRGCRSRGLVTAPLGDLAAIAAGRSLPFCPLGRGPLPGFLGEVSRQGEPWRT